MKIKKIKPLTLLISLHVTILILATIFLLRKKDQPVLISEKIIVLPIEGVISMGEGSLGRGLTVESLVETINDLSEKDDVKALVLRINSPGGSIGAVQELHRALKKFKGKKKTIVSSFADVAASGGYYIACAGDHIVANPGTLTGSIGVIAQFPNFQGLMNKVGVSFNVIKSGSMKDVGSPFRSMTEKERTYITKIIMDGYGQFFDAVKDGRKMDDKTLRPLADGRIFSGQLALENKLIDELGGLDEALTAAKKLTGLTDKNPRIITHKGKPSLERLLHLVSKNSLFNFDALEEANVQLLYKMQ